MTKKTPTKTPRKQAGDEDLHRCRSTVTLRVLRTHAPKSEKWMPRALVARVDEIPVQCSRMGPHEHGCSHTHPGDGTTADRFHGGNAKVYGWIVWSDDQTTLTIVHELGPQEKPGARRKTECIRAARPDEVGLAEGAEVLRGA